MPTQGPPLIDIGPLMAHAAAADTPTDEAVLRVAADLDRACRDWGFVRLTGHGIEPELLARLDTSARRFFALSTEEKARVAMPNAGAAWRGWFPVGAELTAGRPDRKEGLYFGAELPPDHPHVLAGTPLFGANLYPERPDDLATLVPAYMHAATSVGHAVMRGLAMGLGIDANWFDAHLTANPTVLFRIFHYPPNPIEAEPTWGVSAHTDYGLLTLLAQDDRGGLQVHVGQRWVDVPAEPGVLVCNLGDMLEAMVGGRYRSTLHRVRNTSGQGRLSFPFFFDPAWDARIDPIPGLTAPPAAERSDRWDGANPLAWRGTYGEYLTTKVARVFPDLFGSIGPDHPEG
ncbi:MAG: 2-oxoglutarate and iron-dependent oxygenase domain-containing protein [Microthrixaceae bacterium]